MNDQELRDLVRQVPQLRRVLGAEFNLDWDLDHDDAESVYSAVFDDIDERTRAVYVGEAELLERALRTDSDVQAFLNDVYSGLAPEQDLGMSLAACPAALRSRIEGARRSGAPQ